MFARRFKSVAAINIVGLGAAFAVALVAAIQAWSDFTYDRGFANSPSINHLEIDWGGDWGFLDMSNTHLPALWKERVPEIRDYAVMSYPDGSEQTLRREGTDGVGVKTPVREVSAGFLTLFTPEIVAGDPSGTFDVKGRAMITESVARAIFGDANPVGQVVEGESDSQLRFTVDAVCRDFPRNSSVGGGVFTRKEEDTPNNFNCIGFLMFDPADRDTVMAKISDSTLLKDAAGGRDYAKHKFALTPIGDFYLHGSVGDSSPGHINFTIYLLVICLVILVVAVINFINLSMAMAPSRVRSVNIHRILGIGRGGLRLSMALEAVAMAAVLGCAAVHWFAGSTFTDFFSADLKLENNIPLIATCAAGLLAMAFAVGAFVSRYATSFDVAIALKSSFAHSRGGAALRGVLVVVQFTAAIFFICFSAAVWLQYRHMSLYDVGYEKENIVIVPAMADSVSRASFEQEVLKNPRVSDITVTGVPGRLGSTWGRTFEGKEVTVRQWPADANTLRFFGVKIFAGDDFSFDRAGSQFIVNREFLRRYDFTPEQVIGKELSGGPLVGVCEDVNFESLHKTIEPMVFSIGMGNDNSAMLKISGEDVPATLDFIEKTWRAFPDEAKRWWWGSQEWELNFLDERIDALYKREQGTARLIAVLGLVAVAIAVMGVFGLIMFNTRYKRREIAIRKVNGASVADVAVMLNRGMVILVGIALLLAVPLTLIFISRWTAGFAYKAAVPWWLLPAGGLVVLLVAAATVSWQSWRAATANPVNSLNAE